MILLLFFYKLRHIFLFAHLCTFCSSSQTRQVVVVQGLAGVVFLGHVVVVVVVAVVVVVLGRAVVVVVLGRVVVVHGLVFVVVVVVVFHGLVVVVVVVVFNVHVVVVAVLVLHLLVRHVRLVSSVVVLILVLLDNFSFALIPYFLYLFPFLFSFFL